MHLYFCLLFQLFFPFASTQAVPHRPSYSTHNYYVLEHDPSTPASVTDAAQALGVELIQQVGELRNHWLVRTPMAIGSGQDPVLSNHRAIQARATSSPHLDARSSEALHARHVATSIRALLPQNVRRRTKRDAYIAARAPPPVRPTKEKNDTSPANAAALRLGIFDPRFPDQWHIINGELPEHMMNVTGVWEELGITGKGVYVAMVDDGVDYEHEDIKDNFFAGGSYDFNGHQPLPTPHGFEDHHGTRCAGEISAVKNNVCGVGIAYNSKIAGLRILSGPISDVDEAVALNYAYQNTSIYSCSWGPPDNGRAMEAPSYLIQKSVLEGINNGRGGKGSIFVFASGNGAGSGDQCNFDGYTNSIYSITVGAVDHKGLHPYYSEACSANMIVAYSSGSGKNIVTTDIGKGKCSSSHGGTSAAAPIASAVFALALEARPDLTWRDIQHLCVRTAIQINPNDPDWEKTAAGRPFSYKYGFGRLDAWQYVNAAKSWQLVKPQAWIETTISELGGGKVASNGAMLGGLPIIPGGVRDSMTISHDLLMERNFEKLEHINIKVWINHTRRGDVEVELQSPNGIRSILAGSRKFDSDSHGYKGWTFMTIKHWDENPIGNWTLRVYDQDKTGSSGSFLGWSMTMFGSCINPSAAVHYNLSPVTASPGNPLPPPSATEGGTKSHSKPTDHLPGDHGIALGEADKPAFGSTDDAEAAAPSISTTPDEGYFQGMSRLLSNSRWLIGALGAVVLFGIGAVVFFWRRSRRNRRPYSPVAEGEDVPMVRHGGRAGSQKIRDGGRTKELYDAFGEVSDDDADEETSLRRPLDSGGIRFHSDFLEDDDAQSATQSGVPYKDEPDERQRPAAAEPSQTRSGSPGSGDDGSWEHASQQARVE
ncbi:hypothetical protein K439DRAFT_1628243 [Ramaria rubella]|nr:hypothetical protein K439DRAFT_1628243 [Ramaria rubella]